MKKMNSRELLEQLEADARQVMLSAKYLLSEDPELLLQQPAPGKWSIAQVIEHMNSYGRYYLPVMKKVLDHSAKPAAVFFTPGWLGDYFTKSMLPKEGVVKNKMKSPKDHRPPPDIDSKKVLDEFLQQQLLLLQLLEKAKQADMGKLRIPISLAKFITINLGDTFRFFIAHEQRHMVQIANTKRLLAVTIP